MVVVNMFEMPALILAVSFAASFLVMSESTLFSRELSNELNNSRAIMLSLCTRHREQDAINKFTHLVRSA